MAFSLWNHPSSHSWLRGFVIGIACIVFSSHAKADIMSVNSLAEFDAATVGRSRNVLNFDSVALDTTVAQSSVSTSVFQGLTFGGFSNFGGVNLVIADGTPNVNPLITTRLSTISGNQFIGSDAGSFISLDLGTSFTISAPNVSAFGFFIVSQSNLQPDGVGIRIGAATSTTATSIVQRLIDPDNSVLRKADSNAYFVGLVETNPAATLGTITVFAGSAVTTSFGIDNITTIAAVPEPSSMALGLAGVAFGYARLRKFRKLGREKI